MESPPDTDKPPRTDGMHDKTYRNNRRKRKPPFNFELDPDRRKQLREIADMRAISMGAVLRQLISTAYLMDVKKAPQCASGRTCFMPHMHPATDPGTATPETKL